MKSDKAIESLDTLKEKLEQKHDEIEPIFKFYSELYHGWLQRYELASSRLEPKKVKDKSQEDLELIATLQEHASKEMSENKPFLEHYASLMEQVDNQLLAIEKHHTKQQILSLTEKRSATLFHDFDTTEIYRILYTTEALLEIKGSKG